MFTKFMYDTPDSTYFSITNVAPRIEGECIALTNGKGSRRSWGAPQTTSTVVYENCEFIAVHVGYFHKHRGGQGWFYFVNSDTGITRRIWSQLTEDEQDLVLANISKAPGYAKSPGKRKSERINPIANKFIAYKIAHVGEDNSHFISLYDQTAWKIGKRNGNAVGEEAGTHHDDFGTVTTNHDGGFYVHTDLATIVDLFENRKLVSEKLFTPGVYAVLKCECYGKVARFSSGKIAVTYCTPLEVIQTLTITNEGN